MSVTLEEFKKILHDQRNQGYRCAVSRTLEMLQGKWVLRVLYELEKKDTMRFGELLKGIPGITKTMLSNSLKQLEDCGIVKRIQFNEIPPHVEYSLTEAGQAMLPIFYEISNWGEKYLPEEK